MGPITHMASSEEKISSPSSYIPPELIEIVLSKLPSVSVLRFKTVCKSWNTMISDPVFIKAHLHSSNKSPSSLFIREYKDTGKPFTMVKFEGGRFHHSVGELEGPNGPFDHVWCECNGVLLLAGNLLVIREYALWNPSTRMEARFANPLELQDEKVNARGICYDAATDDFKVVVILDISRIAVYSCKSNSWTKKKGIDQYRGRIMSRGIFSDGAIYWISIGGRDAKEFFKIVYFDPRTDELKISQKPRDLIHRDDKLILKMTALRDGILCLYCVAIDGDPVKILRFWIKEKGVLDNPNWMEIVVVENVVRAPAALSEDKIMIKSDGNGFVYYFPREKTFEEIEMREGYLATLVPYVNSLFFPSVNT